MYKILNTKTGLYSRGGTHVEWNKNGKTWSQRSALSNHFAQFSEGELRRIYANCVVVEMEFVVKQEINIDSWMSEVVDRREKRNRAAYRRMEETSKEIRRQEFEKLNKEFGPKS